MCRLNLSYKPSYASMNETRMPQYLEVNSGNTSYGVKSIQEKDLSRHIICGNRYIFALTLIKHARVKMRTHVKKFFLRWLQGRIQDLKLGVAQMDRKFWKKRGEGVGGGGGYPYPINISIYLIYVIVYIYIYFYIYSIYIVLKNRILKKYRGGGRNPPPVRPSKSALGLHIL